MVQDELSVCKMPEMADLLPLYALDALDETDRVRVEDHLLGCAACRAQLVSERETVAEMAFAVSRRVPPQGMRERILAAAQATPSQARQRAEAPHIATHNTGDARLWSSLPAPRQGLTSTPDQPAWMLRRRLARLRDFKWRQATLVAAAALILVLLPWNIVLQVRLTQQQTITQQNQETQHALAAILASPQLVVYPLSGTRDHTTTGHVYVDPISARIAVVEHGLPLLGSGKTYQAWLNHDGERTSVGIFRPSTTTAILVGPLAQPLTYYQSLGVTIEPAGGSLHPTGPNVLLSKL
jgi:hypothetical protein